MRTTDKITRGRHPCRIAGLLLSLLLAAGPGSAQTDDPMLFCMATTVRLANKDWAYVLWDVSAGAALPDEAFAIHARAGAPSAGGTFARVMVAQRQRDPAAIAWLIARAEAIGQTAADLSELLDTVFADLALAPDLTLAQRLAAVIRAADENPEVAENLTFLARRHAAIAMAVGRAAAVPIASSGQSTIELRAYDPATDTSGTLRSRVSVTANDPRILPAPTGLTDASVASPKGHLAIGLRWSVTDAYRRVSLLGFGFNVYRINRAYAEQKGYHLTPPLTADLLNRLAQVPTQVKRVNRLPVLFDDDDTPPGEPYFIDDNNRFEPNATPFADGQQFYYYVTACDVLGRDGDVSPGVLLTARDRLAPLVPIGVQARRMRLYDTAAHARDFGVEVSWKPNPQTSNESTSVYYVYRYTNQTDVTFRSTNTALNRIGAPIAQSTNATRLAFIDTGVGEADIGHNRYYTVRAVEYAAASTNWSGHSAPVACNLRDEDGPGLPQAQLYVDRLSVTLYSGAPTLVPAPSRTASSGFLLVCNLSNYLARSAVSQIEFRGRVTASNSIPAAVLGRYPVTPGVMAVTSLFLRAEQSVPWSFWCRAILKDGRVSNSAYTLGQEPPNSKLQVNKILVFAATGLVSRVSGDGYRHYTPPADLPPPAGVQIPTNGPPSVGLQLDGDSYEWRLYTQIDGGALTLARQGLGQPNTETNVCSEVPRYLHDTWVKYYVQTFDNSGNPSPLRLIGRSLIPGAIMPSAVDSVILTTSGTTNSPSLTITWLASPYGVDRFAVNIGMYCLKPPVSWPASGLSTNLAGESGFVLRVPCPNGHDAIAHVGRYETPRVGAAFSTPQTNRFTVTLPIQLNESYFVQVAAVGTSAEGAPSPWQEAKWTAPVPTNQVEVPWPTRDLPTVRDTIGSDIRPVFIPFLDYDDTIPRNTAAVVIGRVPENPGEFHTVAGGYLLPTGDAVESYLFELDGTDPLPPFVLYRRQVANALFPNVSGQCVQTTPLIESFASVLETGATTHRRIRDPYLIVGKLTLGSTADYDDICVRDRLGIVGGATYEYYLMRFDTRHEPRDVLKLGTVTIPVREIKGEE